MKPIGSRVDPLPLPTPTPPPGAELALPASLPGGWRLSGGPADYTPATAAEPLGEELGRFRGLKSYASAEYTNLAQRVIAVESFVLSSPDAAGGALSIGKPGEAKPLAGDDLDGAFIAGLRAEARKGALLVRVRWFDDDDTVLEDAAIEAMRDVLAAGVKGGLAGPAPTPVPGPAATGTADPAVTPAAAPAPTPKG